MERCEILHLFEARLRQQAGAHSVLSSASAGCATAAGCAASWWCVSALEPARKNCARQTDPDALIVRCSVARSLVNAVMPDQPAIYPDFSWVSLPSKIAASAKEKSPNFSYHCGFLFVVDTFRRNVLPPLIGTVERSSPDVKRCIDRTKPLKSLPGGGSSPGRLRRKREGSGAGGGKVQGLVRGLGVGPSHVCTHFLWDEVSKRVKKIPFPRVSFGYQGGSVHDEVIGETALYSWSVRRGCRYISGESLGKGSLRVESR